MITYANRIYPRISRYLGVFERRGKKVDEHIYHRGRHRDIILFGYDEVGTSMLKSIKNLGKKFLIIDYDPDKITELAKEGYDCRYGDANDTEMLNELDFSKTRMIVSTIPDAETNLLLTKKIRGMNKDAIIIIISHHSGEALKLYESGATYVVMPYFLGGHHASTLIQKHGLNISEFLKERAKHLNHLKPGK